MSMLEGMRWGDVPYRIKEELLSRVFYDNFGETIIYLTDNLSVNGYVKNNNGEATIVIDHDSMLYNPSK